MRLVVPPDDQVKISTQEGRIINMNRSGQIIRRTYETARAKDIGGFVALFASDAIICDEPKDLDTRARALGQRDGLCQGVSRYAPRALRHLSER